MGNLPFLRKTSTFDFENNQHPLLINTVIHEILKDSSIPELRNSRLVCKDWNLEALRLLKKIEGKSSILFRTVSHLDSFVKVYESCPQNILNRSLDCGQILVSTHKEPEILLHTILPIMSCIRGLKVNINIQQKRTFVAHESFQHLAQNLQTFDVRFIKNDNIITPDSVYPRTQLPVLPALTSVKIRMNAFAKYGNIIVHPEYVRPDRSRLSRPDGFVMLDSEYKMLIELIQELVAKSPLLSEIHLIMSNTVFHHFSRVEYIEHKSIRILMNLKRNELEKITQLRFTIHDNEGDKDIPHLLKLAKCGLNRLKYICIDYVYIGFGLNHPVEESLLEMLECQRETLEYFKLKDSTEDSAGDTKIKLPRLLPKLRVIKLSGNFIYEISILDLNTRFPNLHEIDLTGRGFRSQFSVYRDAPLIPFVHVKKLHLDSESSREEFRQTEKRLSEYFPNVTEVKYHLDDGEGIDEPEPSVVWTMTNLEHLVLKVPLYSSRSILLPVFKSFRFISGGFADNELRNLLVPSYVLTRLNRWPNITWLTGLKSLKMKQRRRYGCPEVDDNGRTLDTRFAIEQIGYTILSNMNLEHFSSDLHCFSKKSIAELKVKIPDFEPGRSIDERSEFR